VTAAKCLTTKNAPHKISKKLTLVVAMMGPAKKSGEIGTPNFEDMGPD
jgi:hypothetical protein